MNRIVATALVACMALGAAGCAHRPAGAGDYHAYQVGAEQAVRFGVVESVREVRIHGRESGVGASSGAVIGAIAGSHAGNGSGSVVAAIGGAILGGIIGQEVERSANERRGIEVTVLLDSGKYLAVVQEADEGFRAGDRVRVLSSRGAVRVTR